jgi:hypothetical protein
MGKTTCIKYVSVERFLEKALVYAYPDPNHHIRHLERCFTSHFLHILACLSLASTGIIRYDIIYHLRWNSDAIDFYILESQQSVTTLSASILQGTFARGTTPSGTKL